MQSVLDEVAGWSAPVASDPVSAARVVSERFLRWSRDVLPVAGVEDFEVLAARGPFRVRVYRAGPDPAPPLLYIHGGAWTAGSVELADRFCRRLCAGSGRLVASVDYGLAPEEPYPSGLDDCAKALAWLDAEHELVGSDGTAPAIVGESAGANLAAGLCLRAGKHGPLPIARQVLICPVLGDDFATESHQRFGGGGFLVSSEALAECWQLYLAGRQADAFAAPLRAGELAGLPPTTIVVADRDPLHDDGVGFARGLSEAGGSVEVIKAPGLLHGFIYMDRVSEVAASMVDRICASLSTNEKSEA
jgi:acetyl esterase